MGPWGRCGAPRGRELPPYCARDTREPPPSPAPRGRGPYVWHRRYSAVPLASGDRLGNPPPPSLASAPALVGPPVAAPSRALQTHVQPLINKFASQLNRFAISAAYNVMLWENARQIVKSAKGTEIKDALVKVWGGGGGVASGRGGWPALPRGLGIASLRGPPVMIPFEGASLPLTGGPQLGTPRHAVCCMAHPVPHTTRGLDRAHLDVWYMDHDMTIAVGSTVYSAAGQAHPGRGKFSI